MRRIKSPIVEKNDYTFFGVSFLIFFVYLYQNKPVWTDEFLHLAISSYDFFPDALKITFMTTNSVNHGQTGFYIILNWFLIDKFGFNFYTLRLPSILALLIILWAINILRRKLKLKLSKYLFLLLLLAGNFNLSQFISEARPYYPLAAATLTLFIYIYFICICKISLPSLLFLSSVYGALMHPYFIAYFIVIVGINILNSFLIAYKRNDYDDILRLKKETFQIIVPAFILNLLISIFFYIVAWGNRSYDISRNPFEFSGVNFNLILYFFSGNLSFFSFSQLQWLNLNYTWLFILMFLIFYVILIFLIFKIDDMQIKFFILINFISILILSSIISLLSFLNNYWILSRQWVGSGLIIMFLIFLTFLHTNYRQRMILYAFNILFFIISFIYQINLQIEWNNSKNIYKLEYKNIVNRNNNQLEITDLIQIANWNLYFKQEKMTLFTKYYELKMYQK